MIEFTKEQKQYLKDKLHHLNNAVVDRVIEYLPEINSKTSHNSRKNQSAKKDYVKECEFCNVKKVHLDNIDEAGHHNYVCDKCGEPQSD